MKVAVIGSRSISISNLGDYLPKGTKEIVSGGAKGVDRSAREYALKNNIKLTEFLPEYNRYGKRAPLVRNEQIVKHCDVVLAFWDGESHGTKFTISYAKKSGKAVNIVTN